MPRDIVIKVGKITAKAQLNDSKTAKMIYNALPIAEQVQTWGKEIYFATPVKAELEETAQHLVELGDLAYWPPGKAFCIFFGPTPMSRDANEIKPASKVNIVGKVLDDPKVFIPVTDGEEIMIDKV